ncbi:MAG: NAD(P)H-hydrate epimerase, partial [Tepidisphaeraceae bacterium]
RIPTKSLTEFNQWDDGPMCGVLIDAIYGTGFRPPAKLDLANLLYRAKRECAAVLSIDLPSGMDADTGEVDPHNCITADMTVTLVAEKAGFAHPDAHRYTGQVLVGDIGVPREIVAKVLA